MKLKRISSWWDWCRIYRLYKTAFPKSEQKPFWMIVYKFIKKESDVWVAEAQGEFTGFAITMNALDMVLLDYFAMRDEKRGTGQGSGALKLLQERYRGRRFFLEIESVYEPAENLQDRQRRKAFYLRNGMQEMGIMVKLFGNNMELLGHHCQVDFQEYRQLYTLLYGKLAERYVQELKG